MVRESLLYQGSQSALRLRLCLEQHGKRSKWVRCERCADARRAAEQRAGRRLHRAKLSLGPTLIRSSGACSAAGPIDVKSAAVRLRKRKSRGQPT